ncbi:MAG: hypothetical protein K2I30_03455 [Clostridia bacterium]|nr:hypothetical protein [Clostridia bacterium]
MGKKKKKIAKITEEQYFAYIAGLKEDAALVNSNGDLLIPDEFKQSDNGEKQNF